MTVTVLGSGTSTGVPVVACSCKVCTSTEPENHRLRASLLLHGTSPVAGKDQGDSIRIAGAGDPTPPCAPVLIDTGPDLRQQMLRAKVQNLGGVLYTHFHYDHLAGLDDLKPFTFERAGELTCYANIQTHENIVSKYPYLRNKNPYTTIPKLNVEMLPGNEQDGYEEFELAGLKIRPIRLVHIPKAGVLSTGFVVDGVFGYLTDFKEIHPDDEKFLFGLKSLYLGSPLDRLHVSHISHEEGLALIQKFKPGQGYIGHLSHQYLHTELTEKWAGIALPAYDGLVIKS